MPAHLKIMVMSGHKPLGLRAYIIEYEQNWRNGTWLQHCQGSVRVKVAEELTCDTVLSNSYGIQSSHFVGGN
ncbi:hypothetical protein [Staphylococcus phage vB_SauH_DELF3]|nr:hypothetical protein [Staphylococcus phage vB_SauH_DELF3]